MGERRLRIEILDDVDGMTETELIRRIYRIRHENRPYEDYIRILLTGEANITDYEQLPNAPKGCNVYSWSSRVCERGTRSCIVQHDKELPTETREHWISRMPNLTEHRGSRLEWQQWFREEPPR